MMQMLEAGGIPLLVDDARPADADNPNGYAEYAPVMASARDVSWFDDAPGRAVKVIHALLRSLPCHGELRIAAVVERHVAAQALPTHELHQHHADQPDQRGVERGDRNRHGAYGCCAPRTSRPGSAPVGSPSS